MGLAVALGRLKGARVRVFAARAIERQPLPLGAEVVALVERVAIPGVAAREGNVRVRRPGGKQHPLDRLLSVSGERVVVEQLCEPLARLVVVLQGAHQLLPVDRRVVPRSDGSLFGRHERQPHVLSSKGIGRVRAAVVGAGLGNPR